MRSDHNRQTVFHPSLNHTHPALQGRLGQRPHTMQLMFMFMAHVHMFMFMR